MIKLRNLVYIRLGTADLETAGAFATKVLGLEAARQSDKTLYLRSNDRAYTLYYAEGNPAEQAVGMEVEDEDDLSAAADALEGLKMPVRRGTAAEAAERNVASFIAFQDPTGNRIELVTRPQLSGRRYFPSRDAGITGFNHIGLCTTDPVRDEKFWSHVFNLRTSDRIAEIPLMRISAMHHELALVRSPGPGVQHINHQVATSDDVMRNYYFLRENNVPIVFGPGRHPTSGARFLYFKGPDGIIFEYSCGVDFIADEAGHRPRQFAFEPTSFCQWGSQPVGFVKTTA
jgi:2,3-dihydroxy-p-cumate/2,3-dihydroxybenzoate 3,4-dioxygenase